MSKYSDYKFVRRCIDSCITLEQITSPITNLIIAFRKMHDDRDLADLLRGLKSEKLNLIIKKLKTDDICQQDIQQE